MYEAFELFSKNVREQIQATVKGEVLGKYRAFILHTYINY